ncbi:hypothetical protein A2482_02330 [Candidatus Falkowbacteria bacterium RIFOXYC2_FULL_48_21]|uniref:Transglutaminase-like domain-containing protein n=1 Tax=Candidatus Falkowbacteria bacterium RIFOXYC2_FULL_48_21 TaxID=1798005 RepID=A0A1F5TG38_9BACT|nr:MAG: hypothetical protein A2482_02330 [Candidatus Falkowbacteria bacterium RIFOXYC2_FULL_48_21]
MKNYVVTGSLLFALVLWSTPVHADGNMEKRFADYAKTAQTFYKLTARLYAAQQKTTPLVTEISTRQTKLDELEKILATKNFAAFNDPKNPPRSSMAYDGGWYSDSYSTGIRQPINYGTPRIERVELQKTVVNFDAEGRPTLKTFALFAADKSEKTYRVFVNCLEHDKQELFPLVEILLGKTDSKTTRWFYDYGADGFKYVEYSSYQNYLDKTLHDIFALKESDGRSQVYAFAHYYDYGMATARQTAETESAITPEAVNRAYIPILDQLAPDIENEIAYAESSNSYLVKMSAALAEEISAKEEEIRVSRTADEISQREKERRRILGDTYDSLLTQIKKAGDVKTLEEFQDLVASVETLDDVRSVLADKPISYPAQSTAEFATAKAASYTSPWTTHVRGYGVCDDQAMHAAAFLRTLAKKGKIAKLYLARYGYKSPDGLETAHTAVVIQLPRSGKKPGRWQYFTNDFFSARTFSSRDAAMKESSRHVGYDPDKLKDVRYREITTDGAWLYNDQSSAKLDPFLQGE